MTSPDSYRTWTLSDGHAGNVRQASALAHALGITVEQEVVLRPDALARALAPRLWPGASAAFGDEFARQLQHPPQLAIGCGRQAALATRLLREHAVRPADGERCKVVQILAPRIDPAHWDLVIAPEHDGLAGANVLTLLGSLNAVDDGWLAQARRAFVTFADLPQPRTAVLLGGSSRHVRFDRLALEALHQKLDSAMARDGGSVLVTASRRTGPELVHALRDRDAHTPGVVWLDGNDGTNPYPGLLAWADRIVCSPDSVNMISEACATDAPVFVFDPARAQGRVRVFLDTLLARGRIHAMDDRLSPFEVRPLRETERIAQVVRERLHLV